ncbi:MAG TPA: helix-turn-helix transcriptional regulator [Pedobacter sp.]|jgi:transcriptional regulator with XRE-family HTH domain
MPEEDDFAKCFMVGFGLRLQMLMDALNKKTKKDFASDINLDNSTLGKILKGNAGISFSSFLEIVSKFNVSANWLILGQGDMFLTGDNFQEQELDPTAGIEADRAAIQALIDTVAQLQSDFYKHPRKVKEDYKAEIKGRAGLILRGKFGKIDQRGE